MGHERRDPANSVVCTCCVVGLRAVAGNGGGLPAAVEKADSTMNYPPIAFVALALAGLLTPLLATPALAAEDMQWTFTEINDPNNKGRLTARLSYGVPETDNVQVQGVCDGAPSTGAKFSSVTFGADTGSDAKDGAEADLRFTGGGFDHLMKGTIHRPSTEEGISGVHLDIEHGDALWQALQDKDQLDYLVPGYRASSLDLTRGRENIKKFIGACRDYAKAILGDGKDAAEAQAAPAGAAAPEKEAFESAKELGTKEAWDAFLSNYPSGFHADLARAYLKKLGTSAAGASQSAASPPPAGPQADAVTALPTQLAVAVSCKQQGKIRAKYSDRPTSITFLNKSGAYRGILWLDFEGKPKTYANLNAGERITLDTFLSHPWMVTDGPGNCLQIALPRKDPSLVAIGEVAAREQEPEDEPEPKKKTTKGCKSGYLAIDGKCIKKRDAASYCGPGYRLQGNSCVQGYQAPKQQKQLPSWQQEAIQHGCKPGMGWNAQEGCHEND